MGPRPLPLAFALLVGAVACGAPAAAPTRGPRLAEPTMTTPSSAPAPAPLDPAAEAACRALLQAQRVAWNAGDLEGFVAGYWTSDQVVFAGREGVRLGTLDLLARYRESYPTREAMGRLDFGGLAFRDLGDGHVLAEGEWALERAAGERGGRFVLVLRKLPEGWRIVLDYTTLTRPVDPA